MDENGVLYICIFQNSVSQQTSVISSWKPLSPHSLRCFFSRNFFCEMEAGDTEKMEASWTLLSRSRMSRNRRSFFPSAGGSGPAG